MGLLNALLNIIFIIFAAIVVSLVGLTFLFPKEMGYVWDAMNGQMVWESIKTISEKLAGLFARIPIIGTVLGPVALAVLQGVLLGMFGVWILVRTGKIDEFVKAGEAAMNGPYRKVMLGARCFPPLVLLGMLGILVIDLVKFKFTDIPGDELRLLGEAVSAGKELMTGRP